MKTKRILITLSLGYGINMMGFESSLTREQISVSNPELTVLSLREFCMLSKENLLRMDDMTPDKVAAIERLLAEYSLRLGMSDVELEAYLNRYYEENPKEKEFYDMCDRLCNSKPVFDENRFRDQPGNGPANWALRRRRMLRRRAPRRAGSRSASGSSTRLHR